jgi:hypothetical protein
VTGPDLFWEAKWKSLGQALHYDYHRAVGNVGTFYPPDARTSSIISTGSSSGDYPPPAWVDAIDKSQGRADCQLGEFTRLSSALDWLRVYDPIEADVVVALCVRGRSTVIRGRGVRHWSIGDISERPPFDGDDQKLQRWLAKAWELIGVLIATPASLRKAVEANAVERWALTWCRERGLVP